MPTAPVELHHVEVGVSDLARSLEFYVDVLGLRPVHRRAWSPQEAWLAAGPGFLRLLRVGDGDLGGWSSVNHQAGLRHVGFTVAAVDPWADRLRRSGVEFAIAPMDALGGVRIVFFSDPDGALVELVSGQLRYSDVWDAGLVAARAAHGRAGAQDGGDLVLDHAATTVGDLREGLATYADGLGMGRLGQVPHPGDERGYVRSYLAAGPGVLEVFSYAVDPLPAAADVDAHRLGLRVVALTSPDPDAAAHVVTGRGGRGSALAGPGRHVVDRDGLTLRFLPAGWSPAPSGAGDGGAHAGHDPAAG
ncbi:VOC family protein [Kineococcus aurantiacus]|uniref:Catechol 2,3-dioxygenase-like lactoylglutathione lyase family enzyme n=1 Tax=Kineococcus aurantiacus TaxID=37633 RepID=A0A7Y9ASS0_9ACTN|nr:VOC family protein [Kineococcus aurantiacus]NYD21318.1 catechol 2,3-dioxygenase-like lactoylglutathione lyase family enzyme [Kineococcus aurantiacus]